MTQEEKQLLLKDLCGRLPYGVKINHIIYNWEGTCVNFNKKLESFAIEKDNGLCYDVPVEEVRPYLRPMSSMTEEEEMEVKKLGVCDDKAFHNDIYDTGISMEEAFTAISWFLERHFDINYLIKKGLALEAPEEMYKTE